MCFFWGWLCLSFSAWHFFLLKPAMYVCRELGVCRLPWFSDKHEAETTQLAHKLWFIKVILYLKIHFSCFYPKHDLGLPKTWIQFDFLLERIDLWEFTEFWEWKKWKKHNEHETLSSQNAPAKHLAKRSKSQTSAWQWLEPSKYWLIRSHFVCMRSGVTWRRFSAFGFGHFLKKHHSSDPSIPCPASWCLLQQLEMHLDASWDISHSKVDTCHMLRRSCTWKMGLPLSK